MNQNGKEISLRLSVKGREEILRTMRDMGGEYEKAARKIEVGSRKANAGIVAVDRSAKEARRGLEGMASRGGALGSVLSGLGAGGLAAGAGIGAIGLALAGAMRISREAIRAFDQIGKSADTLLLSTDAFQALNSAAIDEGVAFEKVEQAVRALDKRHSELAANQGELYTRLKDLNPELVEMLKNTVDNDARLRILTKAMQEAETATQRSTIAYAAFGRGGADVARLLVRQADGMDGMIARARELGLVVDEKLIRSAEDLENQFGQASKVIDLQLKQAFIDLAPVMLDAAQLMANITTGLADFMAQFRTIDEWTDRQLDSRIKSLTSRLEELGASEEAIKNSLESGMELDTSGMRYGRGQRLQGQAIIDEFNDFVVESSKRAEVDRQEAIADIRRRMTTEQLKEERAELEAHLKEITELRKAYFESDEARNASGSFVKDPYAEKGIEARRLLNVINAEIKRRGGDIEVPDKEDPKALAELNRLRAEAVKLQRELGDYTAHLAEQTGRYQKMLDAGLISQDQYDRAVKVLTDDLSGVTEAHKKWSKVIEDSLSPVAGVRLEISALNADHEAGRISAEEHAAALVALQVQLKEAKQAELEARPGFADAETIRKDLEQAATDALSPYEKLQKETERVNALMKEGVLEGEDAADWLELYGQRLEEAAGKTNLLRGAEELLDGVQNGRIRTLDDLGRTFSAMLVSMVRDYFAAQQKMQGGSGSFLDFIFGTGDFGFGGPKPSAAGAGAGASAPSSPVLYMAHSGGSGARPPSRRSMSNRMYPREQLMIVEDTETILTASGRMNIAGQVAAMASERHQMAGLVSRALTGGGGGGSGPMKVIINNHAGAGIEATERQGPEGPELSIDVKGKMKEMARGGVFDAPFKQRYGLTPVGA